MGESKDPADHINGKKNKNKFKNSIYQKLVSNQYAIYIILTIIQILNEMNETNYKKNINNENYVKYNNNIEDSDDEEDEKNVEESKNYIKEESDIINNINYVNNYNIIPFEEFDKLKKGILLYIENNTQNKFKKRLLYLMKLNKIENHIITMKKSDN